MPNNRAAVERNAVLLGFAALALAPQLFGCSRRDASLEIVRKQRIERGDLSVTISASGEVKPQNRLEIKPPMSGRIEQILVREGQKVSQGEVLVWMSSTERAALLDVARSQGPDAFAKWEEAYKPAPLIAPLAGTIIVRAVEPGQTVTASDPVVVLADRLIVQALVDETDLSLIRVGQRVDIRLDAYRTDDLGESGSHRL